MGVRGHGWRQEGGKETRQVIELLLLIKPRYVELRPFFEKGKSGSLARVESYVLWLPFLREARRGRRKMGWNHEPSFGFPMRRSELRMLSDLRPKIYSIALTGEIYSSFFTRLVVWRANGKYEIADSII